MMGMWGTIINGAQAAGLEHKSWMTSNWDGHVSAYHRVNLINLVVITSISWTPLRIHCSDVHPVYCRALDISARFLRVLQH